MREINVRRLCLSGIVYRILVTGVNALFFAMGVRYLVENYGPVFSAICWNVINMGLYYLYHYWFLRFFKMEKEQRVVRPAAQHEGEAAASGAESVLLRGEVA